MAGALDADSCDKITSFLVLCDSYNIPIVMLLDTPGFFIGKEGEYKKITGKIINWMNALSQVTVPIFTVILRKSFGLHDIIDPRETRDFLLKMLEMHCNRENGHVGKHYMYNWPTSY